MSENRKGINEALEPYINRMFKHSGETFAIQCVSGFYMIAIIAHATKESLCYAHVDRLTKERDGIYIWTYFFGKQVARTLLFKDLKFCDTQPNNKAVPAQ